MAGLFRNSEGTREGKYLVLRRDGTVPEWPWFVLGAKDPCAVGTLRDYAARCEAFGMDPRYVGDLRALADEWDAHQAAHGFGDPDAGRHRTDDPATVARMRVGPPQARADGRTATKHRCRARADEPRDAVDVEADNPAAAAERFAEQFDRDGGDGFAAETDVMVLVGGEWFPYRVTARVAYTASRY